MINLESALFHQEYIEGIEENKDAKYVCDTERWDGIPVSVFMNREFVHPVSNSKYFCLFQHGIKGRIYIADASWVEDQKFEAVVADDGEIIFSRYRHDFRQSSDGSVYIDGGRDYARTDMLDPTRWKTLTVRDGVLGEHDEDT